ncbi:MAG: alpha-ketoglutarate-dependent dioxygenase AlkB [Halieaceae bacterium]
MDLFPDPAPQTLTLPDSQLVFYPAIELGQSPEVLLTSLLKETPWSQEDITVFGKTHPQPRLLAWYGDKGATYAYSGIAHEPLEWTETLSALRLQMEILCQCKFNSVLLNYYRDHRDSMGLHADDEAELGREPVIASLSLGEQRSLYFKHKTRRELKTFNLPLPSGSVLVMRGPTQRFWKHGLRKLGKPCGPRVNLTFRYIHH